jgi:hypothetical protein
MDELVDEGLVFLPPVPASLGCGENLVETVSEATIEAEKDVGPVHTHTEELALCTHSEVCMHTLWLGGRALFVVTMANVMLL